VIAEIVIITGGKMMKIQGHVVASGLLITTKNINIVIGSIIVNMMVAEAAHQGVLTTAAVVRARIRGEIKERGVGVMKDLEKGLHLKSIKKRGTGPRIGAVVLPILKSKA
jgi:hypothetical protein